MKTMGVPFVAMAFDASGGSLIITRLPTGTHKVLIELVDANHQTLDEGVVNFVIP